MSQIKAYSYVRMSTELQMKGDSKRRQQELSQKYALENGLELDKDIDLNDIGVSAYKGDNLKYGALGKFIDAVDSGLVKVGSYLLVESLDRISRQAPEEALAPFMEIIGKGIVIVTLSDGKVYKKGELDVNALMYSIFVMQRAFEESEIKSQRVSQAWAQKRKNISDKKLTSIAPAWVYLDKSSNEFEVIDERARVVRRIFEYAAAGLGAYSTTRLLNAEKVPPFSAGKGWHISSVKKILKNRAVIGEFQPCHVVEGKRAPIGDPIPSYYPSIVEEQLFNRATAGIATRTKRGAGRAGEGLSNLFSGLIRCGYCSSSVKFINKGSGPKGGKYLLCRDSERRLDCKALSWNYKSFEENFLRYVLELDLKSLLSEKGVDSEKRGLLDKVISLDGQKTQLEERVRKAYAMLSNESLQIEVIQNVINNDVSQISHIEKEIKSIRHKIEESELCMLSEKEIDDIIFDISKFDADVSSDTNLFVKRKSVSAHLNRIIHSISLYPNGRAHSVDLSISFLNDQKISDDEKDQIRKLMETEIDSGQSKAPYFDVVFKNDKIRFVFKKPSGQKTSGLIANLKNENFGLVNSFVEGNETVSVGIDGPRQPCGRSTGDD